MVRVEYEDEGDCCCCCCLFFVIQCVVRRKRIFMGLLMKNDIHLMMVSLPRSSSSSPVAFFFFHCYGYVLLISFAIFFSGLSQFLLKWWCGLHEGCRLLSTWAHIHFHLSHFAWSGFLFLTHQFSLSSRVMSEFVSSQICPHHITVKHIDVW